MAQQTRITVAVLPVVVFVVYNIIPFHIIIMLLIYSIFMIVLTLTSKAKRLLPFVNWEQWINVKLFSVRLISQTCNMPSVKINNKFSSAMTSICTIDFLLKFLLNISISTTPFLSTEYIINCPLLVPNITLLSKKSTRAKTIWLIYTQY